MTERQIFIPTMYEELTLAEDWQVELEWIDRNLVLLRKFKLTGMQTHSIGTKVKYNDDHSPMRNPDGSYAREEVTRNYTVPNPLFRDYEGNYAPAQITIAAGSTLYMSKLYTHRVDLKITASPDKRAKDRVLQVSLETFNTAVIKLED